MKKLLLTVICIYLVVDLNAQVNIQLNNKNRIADEGKYSKRYYSKIDFEMDSNAISKITGLSKKSDYMLNSENKIYLHAYAVPIKLNIDELVKWQIDGENAYGKFTIKMQGAKSLSLNFSDFFLPDQTEMYIYNKGGEMLQGEITSKENNQNQSWGTWVFKGDVLVIEIKVPLSEKEKLKLKVSNIAYGFKKIYESSEIGGFGQSNPCNINVLCPLGVGWDAERNSVALCLSGDGTAFFSGSLIMNTCPTSKPYFLTANHAYEKAPPVRNVTNWRFIFQAWSSTCPYPGVNASGLTFYGSSLKANWAGSDFCLVELNSTPPSNSGIHYAGWNRMTVGINQVTIVHHPRGDLMKISRDNDAPQLVVHPDISNLQCWQSIIDQGATEIGSSGGPYFDQNKRIIGQHYGISNNQVTLPTCDATTKYAGRFDISWTGGGTNATRLSNWLDPLNTGVTTTNTTNVANLPASVAPTQSIIGYYTVNGGSTQTSITNDTYQQIYVPRNSLVTIRFFITTNNFESYSWMYDNVSSSGLQLTANFTAPATGYSSITKTVYLQANSGCGIAYRSYIFNIHSLGWSYRISSSPNPATETVNVLVSKVDEVTGKIIKHSGFENSAPPQQTIFRLYDINNNQLVKQWNFSSSFDMNFRLNTKGLKGGLYVLKMDRGGQTTTTKVIIR